jgi:hypothetical protein
MWIVVRWKPNNFKLVQELNESELHQCSTKSNRLHLNSGMLFQDNAGIRHTLKLLSVKVFCIPTPSKNLIDYASL